MYLTGPDGQPNTPEASVFRVVRQRETNLGNMFADALIWYLQVCRQRSRVRRRAGPAARGMVPGTWPRIPCAFLSGASPSPVAPSPLAHPAPPSSPSLL